VPTIIQIMPADGWYANTGLADRSTLAGVPLVGWALVENGGPATRVTSVVGLIASAGELAGNGVGFAESIEGFVGYSRSQRVART
jgi:hypothetical protein